MYSFEIFGIKIANLIAGLCGGLVSLVFEKKLSFKRALLLIFVGAISSSYLTPILQHWIDFSEPTENAAAFLIGLMSMNILGGLLRLADSFESNPAKFYKNVREGNLEGMSKDTSNNHNTPNRKNNDDNIGSQ